MLILFLSAVAWAEQPPDLQKIRARKELVVAVVSENTPPFVRVDARGEVGGLDAEILRRAGDSLGVKVRFLHAEATYEKVLDLVEKGKADIAAGAIYPTLSRAERFLFTEPYLTVSSVLAANRVERARRGRSEDIKDLLNQRSASIGLFRDAGTMEAVQLFYPLAHLTFYATRTRLIADLTSGKLTGAFIDELEARKWRRAVPNLGMFVSLEKDGRFSREVAFAVHWRAYHLQQWLNLFLHHRKADGTLPKLIDRYLGEAE